MKTKKLWLTIVCLFLLKFAGAQNVLNGVYERELEVQNGDTLETIVRGRVISKSTKLPLKDINIEYFSSKGQTLFAKSNSEGRFEFSGLSAENISAKVICTGEGFKSVSWEFNTMGTSRPRKFEITFELESGRSID